MKEASFTLDKELWKGLRPDERTPRNSNLLSTCTNLKAEQFGLVDVDVLSSPFTAGQLTAAGITISWPFPQLFHGSRVTLLCDQTSVFPIDTTTDPWSIGTAYTTKSPDTPYGNNTITAGGPWHFVDIQKAWLLFNGSCVVFRSFAHDYPSVSNFATIPDEVFCYDTNTMGTGEYFKGRSIVGGFDSSDTHNIWGTVNENMIWFSTVAGGDGLYPFMSDLIDANLQLFLEDRNDWGIMPTEFPGNILSTKKLGDRFIVYGDEGISVGYPFLDPTSSIGMSPLLGVGIAGRGAVAGNNLTQAFIDTSGKLWRVEGDQFPQELGYQEYFTSMLGNTIVGAYNPIDKDFYFSDGTASFLLTDGGLTKITQNITSIVVDGGTPKAIFPAYSNADAFEIVTNEFDMGQKAIKHIRSVETASENCSSIQVKVFYAFNDDTAFSDTGWVSVNAFGIAHMSVSGVDFKLAVKGTADGTDSRLDMVRVKYVGEDKRHIRGVSSSER